jgi:hypothetical protein
MGRVWWVGAHRERLRWKRRAGDMGPDADSEKSTYLGRLNHISPIIICLNVIIARFVVWCLVVPGFVLLESLWPAAPRGLEVSKDADLEHQAIWNVWRFPRYNPQRQPTAAATVGRHADAAQRNLRCHAACLRFVVRRTGFVGSWRGGRYSDWTVVVSFPVSIGSSSVVYQRQNVWARFGKGSIPYGMYDTYNGKMEGWRCQSAAAGR